MCRWSSSIIDIRSRPGSRTDELNGGKYIKIGLDMRYDVGDAEERRVLMCVTVKLIKRIISSSREMTL